MSLHVFLPQAYDPEDPLRALLVTQGNPSVFKGPLKDSLGTHPTFTIQHSTKAVPKGSQLYDALTKTLQFPGPNDSLKLGQAECAESLRRIMEGCENPFRQRDLGSSVARRPRGGGGLPGVVLLLPFCQFAESRPLKNHSPLV